MATILLSFLFIFQYDGKSMCNCLFDISVDFNKFAYLGAYRANFNNLKSPRALSKKLQENPYFYWFCIEIFHY